MNYPKRTIVYWLPAALLAIIIFLLSSCSSLPDVGPRFPNKDKIEHWMFYCVLGCLVAQALRRAHNLSLRRTLWLTIVIASAYGASDEFHQRFVPGRTCDVMDWLADTLGGAGAAAAYYVYESRRSAKANS